VPRAKLVSFGKTGAAGYDVSVVIARRFGYSRFGTKACDPGSKST
jgi:hypothetical protein